MAKKGKKFTVSMISSSESAKEYVERLLFEYDSLSKELFEEIISKLNIKLVRWLAIHHPDSRIRKLLFRKSNVKIGKDSVININLIISDGYKPLVTIGERVAISPNVTIIAQSNPNNSKL